MTRNGRDEGRRRDEAAGGDEALGRDEGLAADFRAMRAELEASGRVPAFGSMLERARAELDDAPETEGGAWPDVARRGGHSRARSTRDVRASSAPIIPRRLWAPLAAAAALVGLLVGLPASDSSDADAEFERLVAGYSASVSAGAWRSPTAPLLDIPGVDLGSLPSFQGSLGGMAPPGADVPRRDS